jgi:hypothetical protein
VELSVIPPYSEADWQRDRQAEAAGEHLHCPNCERDEWFHPVGIPPSDGSRRKYRACKVCGFWQEANGSSAYRCLMTVHTCLGSIPAGRRCEYCGAWGPRKWHPGCWRILPANELGTTRCQYCDVPLTTQHVIPWPVDTR